MSIRYELRSFLVVGRWIVGQAPIAVNDHYAPVFRRDKEEDPRKNRRAERALQPILDVALIRERLRDVGRKVDAGEVSLRRALRSEDDRFHVSHQHLEIDLA